MDHFLSRKTHSSGDISRQRLDSRLQSNIAESYQLSDIKITQVHLYIRGFSPQIGQFQITNHTNKMRIYLEMCMGQWLPFKVGNVRSTKPPTTITSITCRGSRNCEQLVLFRYQVREEWVAMSVNVLSLRLCRCSIVCSKAENLQKCKLFSFNNAHDSSQGQGSRSHLMTRSENVLNALMFKSDLR